MTRRFLLRAVGALACAAVLFAFATLIWPTAYRPIPTAGARGVLAAREHRVTGAVEILTPRGWRVLTPPENPWTALEAKYGKVR